MLLYWLKERAALLTVGKTFILREKTMQKELVDPMIILIKIRCFSKSGKYRPKLVS